MNNNSLIIVAVVAIVLFVMFRGCRQVEVHQKSDNNKSTMRVDVKTERGADY